MTAAQWVSDNERLLRRMLKLPLLWRLAYRLVIKYARHDEDRGACLLCAAQDRYNKHTHELTMNLTRQLQCKKCGLSFSAWPQRPRCSGKPLKLYVEQKVQGPIRILPLNWD